MTEKDRLLSASEIATYLFCKRAWSLSRSGAISSLEAERLAGVEFHKAFSDDVGTARKARTRANGAAWTGVVLLLLAIAFFLMFR